MDKNKGVGKEPKDVRYVGDNPHEGHRGRMMKKLLAGQLLPHEILEVLLFFVIPRGNTNICAHKLLDKFGELGKVLTAEKEELEKIQDVGSSSAEFLLFIGECIKNIINSGSFEQVKCNQDVQNFVRDRFEKLPANQIEVYFHGVGGLDLRIMPFYPEGKCLPEIDYNNIINTIKANDYKMVYIARRSDKPITELDAYDRAVALRLMSLCELHRVKFVDYYIYTSEGLLVASQTQQFDDLDVFVKGCIFNTY